MNEPSRSALLLIDVQRDFCAGGALAVPGAEAILPRLNDLIAYFRKHNAPVYASRDWHPLDTRHFANQGGQWPMHCVAGTTGAQFHPELGLPGDVIVVSKGQTATADGYSAFDGTNPAGEPLLQDLQSRQVARLVVGGLATDYCVRQSVIAAYEAGLDVSVVTDAIAGVELNTGDSQRALEAMRAVGARLTRSDDLLEHAFPDAGTGFGS